MKKLLLMINKNQIVDNEINILVTRLCVKKEKDFSATTDRYGNIEYDYTF